jgi:hypothetical protein
MLATVAMHTTVSTVVAFSSSRIAISRTLWWCAVIMRAHISARYSHTAQSQPISTRAADRSGNGSNTAHSTPATKAATMRGRLRNTCG